MKNLIENIKKFINKYKKQLKNIGIISLIVIVIISIFVLCFYYPFNTKNNNEYKYKTKLADYYRKALREETREGRSLLPKPDKRTAIQMTATQ